MEHLAELLRREGAALGVDLGGREIEALEKHLRLLAKWNAKLNLVGPGTPEEWALRHTLDSLAVAEWIGPGERVIDVGSGAGFPGIPCAIVRPSARIQLLEPRANRAAFLQNVVALTALSNVAVRSARAEEVNELFDLVLGRAVAPPAEWAAMATRLCAPGGGFVLFSLAESPEALGDAMRVKLRTYGQDNRRRWASLYVPRGTSAAVS